MCALAERCRNAGNVRVRRVAVVARADVRDALLRGGDDVVDSGRAGVARRAQLLGRVPLRVEVAVVADVAESHGRLHRVCAGVCWCVPRFQRLPGVYRLWASSSLPVLPGGLLAQSPGARSIRATGLAPLLGVTSLGRLTSCRVAPLSW